MKVLLISFMITMFVSGCSTVAGTVRGLGEDVKSGTDAVGNWIKPESKEVKK